MLVRQSHNTYKYIVQRNEQVSNEQLESEPVSVSDSVNTCTVCDSVNTCTVCDSVNTCTVCDSVNTCTVCDSVNTCTLHCYTRREASSRIYRTANKYLQNRQQVSTEPPTSIYRSANKNCNVVN